jgi:hypothetical protein
VIPKPVGAKLSGLHVQVLIARFDCKSRAQTPLIIVAAPVDTAFAFHLKDLVRGGKTSVVLRLIGGVGAGKGAGIATHDATWFISGQRLP